MGSGGIGAVSIGFADTVVFVLLAFAIVFGVWKLAKLLWAVFSG